MNMTIFILSTSVILQLAAVVLSIRLIRISEKFVAWLVIGAAFFVQFVRRSYVLYLFLSGGSAHPPDLVSESLGLFISLLMVIGIGAISPVIRSLRTIDEKISESDKRYCSLFENIQEGFQVIGFDWKYLLANDVVARQGQKKKEELLGRTMMEMYPGIENTAMFAELKRCMEERVSHRMENEFVFPDGSKGWYELSIYTVPDGVAILSQDITERKRAEEVLRESERKFSDIVKYLDEGYYRCTMDGLILDHNQAFNRILGFDIAQDLKGAKLPDFLQNPDNRKRYLDELLTKGFVMNNLMNVKTIEGKKIVIMANTHIVKDEKGRHVRIEGTFTDFTEFKKLEEQMHRMNIELEERVKQRTRELEYANKELEAFSFSVSHDLRAPLRAIDGFSIALLEDCSGQLDDQGKAHLQRVRSAVKRMGELIDDLLDFSRITRQEIEYRPVDLTKTAKEIALEFQKAGPDRQVEFCIQEGMTVNGDALLLGVALQNLLENAWKFTGKHSRAKIEFGTQKINNEEVYFVRDNGVGFDMAYVDKLFEPFQRLHSEKDFPGTGIGLATVKRIIHRHGGRVWVEGEIEKGTCFYFTLLK